MKRIYCDFCGHEVRTEPKLSEYVTPKLPLWKKLVISAVIENDPRYGGKRPESYDMCDKCESRVLKWLKLYKRLLNLDENALEEMQRLTTEIVCNLPKHSKH